MPEITRSDFRGLMPLMMAATACIYSGCSSDPGPPPLTPLLARQLIAEKWVQDDLNHYRVTFHSDSLVECGIRNGLWKLEEVRDSSGNIWSTAYRLTEKGSRIVHSIDLKESGRGHQLVLRGPYRSEIGSITEGALPNQKRVAFKWQIDWDKSPEELKACAPRFELAGSEVAVVELVENTWKFTSYLHSGEPAQAGSVAGNIR